jgi:hypothetical protein
MVIINGVARQTTLADGSTRVLIDLGELSGEKVGEIHSVNRKVVFIAFAIVDFTDDEKQIIEEAVEIAKIDFHGNREEKRQAESKVRRPARRLG